MKTNQHSPCVIGVDYGTDSVRAVIINAANGEELASSVFYYPRWKKGLYCDPSKNQFRQHPLDYIEGLEATIKDCLQKAGKEVSHALLSPFENNPNAMFVLWKDHTATKEAAEINNHSASCEKDYLQFVG